jgi:acetaldehyde dehydrogenase/alcohol dehydrogenase
MSEVVRTKGLDIEEVMEQARISGEKFSTYSQERVDQIVKAVYQAGFNNRVKLAKMAHEETGLGKWEDKVSKNVIATRYVYHDIKDLKTAGILREDSETGITEVAKPVGPIFAMTPITNPTSTALFKILIAMKTRNPIIIRPHGSARKCTCEAARICYEAAVEAGAPEDCIQWVKRSTPEETLEMMGHKLVALVLATGSVSLVKSAYRSGNPAIGVGPGNVPVYIGQSADLAFAVDQIILSKTFDYGTVCASEQSVVIKATRAEALLVEFRKRKAYILNEAEIRRLEEVAFNKSQRAMSIDVIGQPAFKIAKMAGIDVPEDTTVLIARYSTHEIGIKYPLSLEILAPILAMYVVDDFIGAINMCKRIVSYGGMGHTISIFSNEEDKIMYFAEVTNAGRLLVNTPASQGALGGTYNGLQPSLTLATGAGGKNITTDNITAKHLLNVQRLARRTYIPCNPDLTDIYLDEAVSAQQIDDDCEENRNKTGRQKAEGRRPK